MTDPITCMAIAIYFEARGEPPVGQMLVADTIINRVESDRYPDDVCEVVKQKHQFSFYWDGKPEFIDDEFSLDVSRKVALLALTKEERMLQSVCHYARHDIAPHWAAEMHAYLVGNHVFYGGGC